MKTTIVEKFNLIGIAIRTTNENGQSATDIPQLWNKFLSKNIILKIPNKIDDTIYCVYTDYEKDYTKPYTTILGCRVETLNKIPENLIARSFAGGEYAIFKVNGKITDNIIYKEWVKIWNSAIPRAYTADFEIYDEKAQNPNNAEIDIFIAVKP